MSELTLCNYCVLKQMRSQWKSPYKWERMGAKKSDRLYVRHEEGWVAVWRVPKGKTLSQMRKENKDGAGVWFMELTDHCVC